MRNMLTFLRRLVGSLLAVAASSLGYADDGEYADTWGPDTGSQIAAFELDDSVGDPRTLDSLASPAGLILFFTRSADW